MFKKKITKLVSRFNKLKDKRAINVSLKGAGLLLLIFVFYNLLFLGRISPGVSVAGISLRGKTPEEATRLLSREINHPNKIALVGENQTFEIDLSAINFSYDFVNSAQAAYKLDKTGNIVFDLYKRITLPARNVNLALRINLNEEKLSEILSIFAGQTSVEPVYPSAKLVKGEVLVEKGVPGQELDVEKLRLEIGQSLAYAKDATVFLSIINIDPTLAEEEAESFKERAESLLGKSLSLEFEYQTFTYKNNALFKLLDPKGEYNEAEISSLVLDIAAKANREPQNPTFVFEAGRVREFAPAKDGIEVRQDTLSSLIIEKLKGLETSDEKMASLEIPVDKTEPKIKTGDVNNLGIKELIGRGTSRFRGSISSRIYNISLAASLLNGNLIEPGQTFSFNAALGDVSKLTGYKEAFIIKDGRTVLGDGGGVCQVSTTFFRAVLGAGLPITERRAHSYRVGYYEQDSLPGFDATVYAPTTDLKIKNDTPGHILIQAYADTRDYTLVFELYGTADGRVTTTTKPVTTGLVAPPEDLYQDDPTLPLGTIKQVDWKAWGAKSRFNYQVSREGELIYEKTFYSNYRPWQAVYLRGTGPLN